MIVLISPEIITSSLTELLETNYGCPNNEGLQKYTNVLIQQTLGKYLTCFTKIFDLIEKYLQVLKSSC